MNNKELTELKKFIDGRIEFLFDHWVEHDKPPYTFGGWREEVVNDIANKLTSLNDEIKREALKVTGETSDGYHTFNELYAFRKVFNAGLFNEWSEKGLYKVHKSKKHSDGEECFGGGWFIVTATLPTGQISNHYELGDWDLFQCEEREKADVWDGHTPQDVLTRLTAYLTQKENNE